MAKSNVRPDEFLNPEFFALASQLYVKMRRQHNRVIDSIYMTQNPAYAKEILRLASVNADAEMSRLIDRLEVYVPVSEYDIPVLDLYVNELI